MEIDPPLNEKIAITLRRDEAIVLLWYLSREVWKARGERLRPTFEHPAEEHALEAALTALIPPLGDAGGPDDTTGIERAAREHLLRRFA